LVWEVVGVYTNKMKKRLFTEPGGGACDGKKDSIQYQYASVERNKEAVGKEA